MEFQILTFLRENTNNYQEVKESSREVKKNADSFLVLKINLT